MTTTLPISFRSLNIFGVSSISESGGGGGASVPGPSQSALLTEDGQEFLTEDGQTLLTE